MGHVQCRVKGKRVEEYTDMQKAGLSRPRDLVQVKIWCWPTLICHSVQILTQMKMAGSVKRARGHTTAVQSEQ